MTSQYPGRRRRALLGTLFAVASSVGLVALALIGRLATLSDVVVFPAVVTLAVVMGLGATLTIFNLGGREGAPPA